jgi:1-acyl-sn-glycerol-3-phosphate acyltransferase
MPPEGRSASTSLHNFEIRILPFPRTGRTQVGRDIVIAPHSSAFRRRLARQIWFYRGCQILLGWPLRALFRTSVRGVHRIPKRGAVILASNHVSFLDGMLVAASIPRPVFYLSSAFLFRNRLSSFLLEVMGGQIPVGRQPGDTEETVAAGIRLLECGYALGIFPEGTRSPHGKLLAGQTGVALFAFLTGAPVLPVALRGTYEAWPRHKRFPRLFRRTGVVIGDPLQVLKNPASAEDPKLRREFTDDVMLALAQLLHQP